MLWDAEGMILSKDREAGETNMDVVERYLGELVGRCMIEAELDDEVHPNVRRRYKSCWFHDLMRELCWSIVKKEDFLTVHDYRGHKDKVLVLHSSFQRNNNTKIPPRQVFYFSGEHEFIVHDDKLKATRKLTSVMVVCGRAGKSFKLKKLNFLRVLSFYGTSIGKEAITNELIHLRYLSFNLCYIRRLPSPLDKFIYLQTLDMQAYLDIGGILLIPNLALRKLKRLKHLFLPFANTCKVTPKFSRLRLDGLTNLETLVNLDSKMCEMNDVVQLTNLRRLEWTICISSEDDGKMMKELMNKVNLDTSRHSSLEIAMVNPKVEMYSNVLRGQLTECCKGILHKLQITGVTGKLVTEFSNFSRLTKLILSEFDVEEDPMPTLEKLSNLKELYLRNGKLKGKEMSCSTTGFPQLSYLNFSSIENWEKWWVDKGAMPSLSCLCICGCSKLEMLPDELKFITTFEELRIWDMPEEFRRRMIGGAGDRTGGERLVFNLIPDHFSWTGWDIYKIRRRR